VREFGLGNASSGLGASGSDGEQVVRIDTKELVCERAQALVVTVAGEIDRSTVERVRAAVDAGLDQLHAGVVLIVDLTNVTFLESAGLQALVDVTETAQERGAPLRIVVGHSRAVLRTIQLTGLTEVLPLFDTVEHALQPTS
jgi:anti-sigma B factor antagonist